MGLPWNQIEIAPLLFEKKIKMESVRHNTSSTPFHNSDRKQNVYYANYLFIKLLGLCVYTIVKHCSEVQRLYFRNL